MELLPEEEYEKLRKKYGPLAEHVAIHQNPDNTLRGVIRFGVSTALPHTEGTPYLSATSQTYENILKWLKEEILETLESAEEGTHKKDAAVVWGTRDKKLGDSYKKGDRKRKNDI